ncbi:MAG: ATPase, partial [Hyphomicrobiaceae bacterium]
LRDLAASTMLIHLRGTGDDARMLVERFSKAPKPMYYNPSFLDAKWAEYKALKGGIADDAVDPDDFVVWGYEELLRYRLPIYQKMADRHGYTIDAADLAQAKTDGDVLNLVAAAVDKQAV